jgi:hypothetical protein
MIVLPPMVQNRISAETAAVPSPAFKALGDPIRLQLTSMIVSAPGGEICVMRQLAALLTVDETANA